MQSACNQHAIRVEDLARNCARACLMTEAISMQSACNQGRGFGAELCTRMPLETPVVDPMPEPDDGGNQHAISMQSACLLRRP